jgi:hypothetical protein
MLWTEFSLQGQEIRFDSRGGYRVVRKQRVLAEPVGEYVVYGYDLIIDVSQPAEAPGSGARPASRRTAFGEKQQSYVIRFSYPESADSGVLPQPLEQALLAGIRADGRPTGKARVEQIEYLGSGRFKATVLVGD